MGIESLPTHSPSADDSSDAISNMLDFSRDFLAEAGRHLDSGLKFAGITKPAVKLIEDLGKHSDKSVLSWFLKLPAIKMLQIAMVAGQIVSGGPAKAEDFAKAVNTTYQMSQAQRKIQSIEITKDLKTGEAPDVKLQHFLDAIQGPVQNLQPLFANTGDPVKDQAWRFAIANVFTAYDNRITAEHLNEAPGYEEKMQHILGVPIDIVDIVRTDSTPAYKTDYAAFKEQIFTIYKHPEFARLQHEVRDSRLFFYYEVLDRANSDQPDYEKYREENTDLIAEAGAFFKKDENMRAIMSIMDPGEFGITEDKRGGRVALDIPDTLQS